MKGVSQIMKDAVLKIVKDLRCLAHDLESFANLCEEEGADLKTKPEQKETKEKVISEDISIEDISIEDVRRVLISKSQDGKQKEVKALIQKYGAHKLTDLNTSCYKDLLKDAEAL